MKCEICKATINIYHKDATRLNFHTLLDAESDIFRRPYIQLDICPDCVLGLKEWIKTKKKIHNLRISEIQ